MNAEFSVVSFVRPGDGEIAIGILVFDRTLQQLRARFRNDWNNIADTDDIEVLSAIAEELIQVGRGSGAEDLLNYLEDTCSNSVRVTPRSLIETENLDELIVSLYTEYVDIPRESNS